MKTFVPCLFAALLATSAFAVRAPRPAASAFDVRKDGRGGLRRPTTDFTHLRTALQAKASAARRTKLLKASATIPGRWDSREQGWVTSVKNQRAYGTCWAFSTLAALETAYLKATDGAVTNDFSENHMATHDVGFGFGFSAGGNNQVAAALLASWRDPLLEREDPYPHPDSKTNAPPQCHVQDIVWLPERFCPFFTATEHYAVDAKTDNSEVDEAYKRAVMEYGAVAVGYYHSWNSYNRSTAAHYLSSSNYSGSASDGGHAVTLIGWDDDYPAANFRTGKQPPGNGAFLCKNSWGHSSDTTNGCTWISYYDEALFDLPGASYPLPEARTNYGRVYEYDPCGQVGSWNAADTEAETVAENWCANVFTAVATGIVEAVGFYAMSADTAYTLRVYRGCASTPVDGELLVEQTGVVANAGYATVRLATPVSLKTAGTKFSVVLKLACPGYDFPLPAEFTHYEKDEYGQDVLWCACTANAGESFISKNGRDWRDFQDYDKTANFCVKAYTRFGSDGDARPLIADGSPAETALAVRVGEPQTFSVTPTDEAQGEGLSYEWRVNGIPSDCNVPVFVFTPTFAQRGNCAVECLVQSGPAVDVRAWSLSVNADLHVAAGSAAAEPDGSPERPFATVADACVAAIEGDTVLVGPGVYYGTLEGPSVQIEIRSTQGPEATVLDADGSGRCFLASQNDEVVLSGFTLRNADAGDYLGGGVFGGVITNCVISNCVAAAGGGACQATLQDCRVVDCWAAYYGGGICDTVATDCLLFGNEAYQGGAAGGYDWGCDLYGCTVVSNRASYGGGVDLSCLCWNSILWANVNGHGRVSNWDYSSTGVGWVSTGLESCCTYPPGHAGGAGCIYEDPLFVSAARGDWRLSARSPCIDAGDNARVAAARDLGGAARIVGARVDMGCYEFCQTLPGWPTPAVKPGATAAEEARAVAAAMSAAGFGGEKASALSSAAQYAALSDWTASRGLDVAALAASPTAFVSAAFDAPGLLDLSAADLQTTDFAPAADGIGWKLTLAMEAYDPARVNPALLRAAVGVVGSETPTGGYSADGLSVSATPAAVGIDIVVTPPSGKRAYFMRSVVR